MRSLFLLAAAALFFTSCNNNGATGKTFCDTACRNDSFVYRGDDQLKQMVFVSVKGCEADTVGWTHIGKETIAKVSIREFVDTALRLHPSATSGVILDTTAAWVSFNDCLTGRGYLIKINLANDGGAQVISGALNGFVPKFSIDPDLRAYTDRGNLYVENVKTNKMAQMTFKKNFAHMDFYNIHQSIDTLNVTRDRMYIVLIDENGNKVPFEKKISL